MKGIDLELGVRAALYSRLSAEQLQAICVGDQVPEMMDLLASIACEVTPRIGYPQTPAQAVAQLADLARDLPARLPELPVYIAKSPEGGHSLLPNVPLKGLYINALDRAIRFGLDEVERLAGLGAVPSEAARTLLWAMEKAYVEEGHNGGFWMRSVLLCLGRVGWEEEAKAREGVLAELGNLGLIQLRGSRAEIYDLTLDARVPLVKKHRLWEKWDEYHCDGEAVALARAAPSTSKENDR
jgi:hypothetical protein